MHTQVEGMVYTPARAAGIMDAGLAPYRSAVSKKSRPFSRAHCAMVSIRNLSSSSCAVQAMVPMPMFCGRGEATAARCRSTCVGCVQGCQAAPAFRAPAFYLHCNAHGHGHAQAYTGTTRVPREVRSFNAGEMVCRSLPRIGLAPGGVRTCCSIGSPIAFCCSGTTGVLRSNCWRRPPRIGFV